MTLPTSSGPFTVSLPTHDPSDPNCSCLGCKLKCTKQPSCNCIGCSMRAMLGQMRNGNYGPYKVVFPTSPPWLFSGAAGPYPRRRSEWLVKIRELFDKHGMVRFSEEFDVRSLLSRDGNLEELIAEVEAKFQTALVKTVSELLKSNEFQALIKSEAERELKAQVKQAVAQKVDSFVEDLLDEQ